jgi:hypothetical protein
MPSIIKRPRARSDLSEIWDYIAADNETRADAEKSIDCLFLLCLPPKTHLTIHHKGVKYDREAPTYLRPGSLQGGV